MQALQIVLVVGILAFILGSFAWKKGGKSQADPRWTTPRLRPT